MELEKLLKYLLYIALGASMLVIGTYFYKFHFSLSGNSQEWSNFGGYIGGTLGPFYALLAFFGLLESLKQARLQREIEGLLQAVQKFEKQFLYYSSLSVACNSPWIWGHEVDVASDIKELPLRTLLESDAIDWEVHLGELSSGLQFRRQGDGALYQDRDIILRTKLAIKGLFDHLDLYLEKGGERSIYNYYLAAYEIQKNRLA